MCYRVKGRPHYHSTKKEEYAHIRFDLDADLSSLFNWNTKQLFVWVEASYPSSSSSVSGPPSRAVIWDTIITAPPSPLSLSTLINTYITKSKPTSKSTAKKGAAKPSASNPGILKFRNTKPKYQITDVSGLMAERANVTLEVGWNVQPWVGALTWAIPDGGGFGRWGGIKGGKSESFVLPGLKGAAKKENVDAVRGAESPRQGSAKPVI